MTKGHHPISNDSSIIWLLLKYSLLGGSLLLLLISYHGGSPKNVLLSSSLASDNLDFNSKLNSNVNVEYPEPLDADNTEPEDNEDINDILSSPEEAFLTRKEGQLAAAIKAEAEELKKYKKNDESNDELLGEAIEIEAENGKGMEQMQGPAKVAELGGLRFSDGLEYMNAPSVSVGKVLTDEDYAGMWNLQTMHDEFFRRQMHRRFIPRLDQPISKLEFHQIFRQTSTPVIIPFHTLRNHGFLTKHYSLEELQERFPFTPPKDGKAPLIYTPNSGIKEGLDLGPAIYALKEDQDLAKAKGFKRSFPRNMKLKSKYLAMLEISHPPFVPKNRFQPPTLWFGTSTADTKLHSDCCDNFVQMISGTKRWYIVPPSDSRHLAPIKCQGTHQSLCWSSVEYPNKPLSHDDKVKLDATNSIVVDLKAGDMLYLPAGWWHHIENLGPTIMVNFWTYGCENVAVALDLDPVRNDRPDFKRCPAVAQSDASFIYK